jgi:hypothetical protein
MYWIRSGNFLGIGLYLLLSLGWMAGGWLLVVHTFRLRRAERLLSGLATGLLLFISLSNILANLLPLPLAFWIASAIVLAAGILAAMPFSISAKGRLSVFRQRFTRKSWQQMAVLVGVLALFTLIGRGLALFDDYLHIPLVSVMAAGDIPPHFYLNPGERFAYHYGLQVLAASLVRVGGFFPWSAWDISKALAITLSMLLGWLWFLRVTRSKIAAALGSFLLSFAGGARWLLLLIPAPWLQSLSSNVQLSNSALEVGKDLAAVLTGPWLADGSGPIPFPFAFHNGIFVPLIFVLGSSGALPFLILLLLLLLAGRRRSSPLAWIILALIFSSLALSAEHVFVFLWSGIALAVIISLISHRGKKNPEVLQGWIVILGLGGLLSVVQGGFITEAVHNVLLNLQGMSSATSSTYNYYEFGLRWPPALISAHLGELSLVNPGQLLVLLAELGTVLLIAPLATVYAWRCFGWNDWLQAGLGLSAVLGFLVALFFHYGVERSITRLPASALWIWLLIGYPLLWKMFIKGRPLSKAVFLLCYGVTVLGGLVIFAVQIAAIPYPQTTYFVNSNDARISQDYWNKLPANTQIFDPISFRSVALFGRPSHSSLDFYHPLPEWEALLKAPDPVAIARAGYYFVYMDRNWWKDLKPRQQKAFQQACVKIYAQRNPLDGDFRWLLDVHDCR